MQPRRAEKQVSVMEQSFCPARFTAQNMRLGHAFPPAALWETHQSFVPLIQFDTTAADFCTFADLDRIWLQKQASVKWRCKIFMDIYKLEGNKRNFRPDTL